MKPEEIKNPLFVPFNELVERSMVELDATDPTECIETDYKWLDDKIVGLFKGELLVVGGETGCLHPDTIIFDPTDNSKITVKERSELGKDFHVFSLNQDGKIIIAKADSPKKFIKTKMYELTSEVGKIVVTGKHRVWDGEKYTTVDELSKFDFVRLPSIGEFSLSKLFGDVQSSSQKVSNSQCGYHSLVHLCGLPLQLARGISQYFSPSQGDVLSHIRGHLKKDVWEDESGHNHPCRVFVPLSKKDSYYQQNKNLQNESQFHSTVNTSSLISQLLSKVHKSYSYLLQICKVSNIHKSSPDSKVDNTDLNFVDFVSSSYYTTWAVKQVEEEVYYDFHVPVYENYYACGLFNHNSGKTTFVTNICYRAANRGIKVDMFALEDRLVDYGIKAVYFELGKIRKSKGYPHNYPWGEYRKNKIIDPNYKSLRLEAENKVKNSNLSFAEIVGQMNIDILEAMITQRVAEGTKLFLIDHLHYFDMMRTDSSRAEYVEHMMVRIKSLQNRTGARIILIVHYKKLEGKKPMLDSFKDSVAIPQNANYVVNMWRDRGETGNRFETTFFIPKARNPNGEATIKVNYDPDLNDYYDVLETTFGTPQQEDFGEHWTEKTTL